MSTITITVSNSGTQPLFIANDPNWDDQQLQINQQPLQGSVALAGGQQAELSLAWPTEQGNEYMLGLIFATKANYDAGGVAFYQLSLGVAEQGILTVTEECVHNDAPAAFQYQITSATAWHAAIQLS